MPDKVFGSQIDDVDLSGGLPALAVRDSVVHSYAVITDSRLWVMRAQIRGEELQSLANDYQISGVLVTVQYRLINNPEPPATASILDFVSDRVASFPLAPGNWDLWIRVQNTGTNSYPSLDGSIEFGFIVVPDVPGFPS